MSEPAFVQLFKPAQEPCPNGQCGRCGRWIVYDTEGGCACEQRVAVYDPEAAEAVTTTEERWRL